ncbi:MAG: helix-turn-helix domain-containing protein [Treponemataceae bacterium]|nr:helix-turn-helix domain-containing protein [Treponemataceae bacterium]MDE7226693.1 helix-turn-helix domain-containing protein [Treponemataceae bacterium]
MKRNYMSDEMFGELVGSMHEAAAISRGEAEPSRTFTFSPVNVRKIREKANKSQDEFAAMIGVKVGTLRNWEQGRRNPDGAALTLLKVVAENPAYVEKILRS